MCTVTWQKDTDGYRLYFNRDERNTRAKAKAPDIELQNGIEAIMPIDGEAGGTWISTNSRGISMCLINNYGAELQRLDPRAPSRGIIVKTLAFHATTQEVKRNFHDLDPKRFNPFDFFVFDHEGNALCLGWDGERLNESIPLDQFAFSAGYDQEGVVSNRRALFHQWLAENKPLDSYHRSHIPEKSFYSVCMHRPAGGTQSLSKIEVYQEKSRFTYVPGPPCETDALQPICILRS